MAKKPRKHFQKSRTTEYKELNISKYQRSFASTLALFRCPVLGFTVDCLWAFRATPRRDGFYISKTSRWRASVFVRWVGFHKRPSRYSKIFYGSFCGLIIVLPIRIWPRWNISKLMKSKLRVIYRAIVFQGVALLRVWKNDLGSWNHKWERDLPEWWGNAAVNFFIVMSGFVTHWAYANRLSSCDREELLRFFVRRTLSCLEIQNRIHNVFGCVFSVLLFSLCLSWVVDVSSKSRKAKWKTTKVKLRLSPFGIFCSENFTKIADCSKLHQLVVCSFVSRLKDGPSGSDHLVGNASGLGSFAGAVAWPLPCSLVR